jgi:mevalonate kinase
MSASVPGKIFLLGEYAVLGDRTALIAAVGPRFRMVCSRAEQAVSACHPSSPAGRLVFWAREQGIAPFDFRFEDPHLGAGGFGASTAQFALTYFHAARACGLDDSALGARALSRELMGTERLCPSGADLVAQWHGGVTAFDPACGRVMDHFGDFDWRQLLIFSATGQEGRKVATHEHLDRLACRSLTLAQDQELLDALEEIVLDALAHPHDLARLGSAFVRYAETLNEAGLEIAATEADRLALTRLPGVLGAKGAGALQADALLVLLDPHAAREPVIAAAQSRGLRLAADGIGEQPGIRLESAGEGAA